jgi:hypothetical protein
VTGVAASREGDAKDVDLHAPTHDGAAARADVPDAEPVTVAELRTLAPAEIQILAATGC